MLKRLLNKYVAIGLIVTCAISLAGTSVSWMGTTYTIPSTGETDWSGPTKVDGFLTSVASNALSKAGGNFTLTADVNFGASFGLLAPYFSDRTTPATVGLLRLANGSSIAWRNAGNSANLPLWVDATNALIFNGVTLSNSSGVMPVASGGTGLSSYTAGDTLYASGSTTLSKLAIGSSGMVYVANTSAPIWQKIENANIDDSAAIARSKVASGSASHVVINDGSGNLSSEAQVAVSRGGTNISSYTTGDLLYASGSGTLSKLGIGTTGQRLAVSGGGLPTWAAASAASAGSSISADYTISSSDDLIFADASGGSLVLTLPAAASNSGKVIKVKKIDTASSTVEIRRAGTDKVNWQSDLAHALLKTLNENIELFSDGVSSWKVTSRGVRNPTIQRFTSGSGTYTTPTERVPTYIRVKMVGGGGEGGPDGTGGGSGTTGGSSTFGTSLLTAVGGTGATNQAGAAGGACTVNSPATSVVAVTGGSGSGGGLSNGSNNAAAGGAGGNSFFGGGGAGGSSAASGGSAGATNTGAGGGGEWSPNNPNTESGGGGGAGCYIEALIYNPSATYSYAVGAGGTGASGADGGSGVIIVEEYYN